jgi:hypothetical protein
MEQLKSPMDILKILPKTNCRDCGEKTCLAFASAVFNAQKTLDQCPHLDAETLARFSEAVQTRRAAGRETRELLNQVREPLSRLDLAEAADRLGGRFDGSRLTIKVLGRDFHIHDDGRLSSEIHINPWVVGPVVDYALHSKGLEPTGVWVQFRDLVGGPERLGLFQRRCVDELGKVADRYPDFFKDMLEIFSGNREYNQFGSDVSVVLLPLPKVPLLICYWRADEGMDSDLSMFFDQTADENLGAESIFTLAAGLANMFEKIARSHGF